MLVARVTGIALLAGAGVVLIARPVEACTCSSGPTGVVRFPRDGATDVATDTPIVIERYYLEGNLDDIAYALTDAAGTEVVLEETRRQDPAWDGCGEGQYLFLRPAQPLAAGATYTLSIAEEADPEGRRGATFTVGEQAFAAQPPIDLQPTYLAARPELPCDETPCGVGEIRVDLGGPPAMPLWLVIKSGASGSAINHWELWPEYVFEGMDVPEWASAAQISVVLPEDDPCIDIELFGVEGRTLFEQRRCEPDLCAALDGVGFDDCGGPPFAGIDISTLPAGSCGGSADAGAVLAGAMDAGTRMEDVGDAGALAERTSVEAEHPRVEQDGCSVSAPRTVNTAWCWPAAFMILCTIRGMRRRWSVEAPTRSNSC